MVPLPISCFHSILPSGLLILSATRFSPSIAVMNRLLAQIAGVLAPSASGHFQAMPDLSSHFRGRLLSLLTLSPLGPRHCGQLPARADMAKPERTSTTKAKHRRLIRYSWVEKKQES